MKEKMFKYFTANNTTKYYNILDDLVTDYNNTYHTSIKLTPVESSKKVNEDKVRQNLYPEEEHSNIKPKFEVGDRVRITKKKKFFEKSYTPKWTTEIFVVDKVIYTNPVTYKIKDLEGEEIIGSFYEKELQKTSL
jgi:hypothetical protein